jgi:F-box-like
MSLKVFYTAYPVEPASSFFRPTCFTTMQAAVITTSVLRVSLLGNSIKKETTPLDGVRCGHLDEEMTYLEGVRDWKHLDNQKKENGLLSRIFSYLDYHSLVSCTAVCRSWNKTSEEKDLWKPLLQASMSEFEGVFQKPSYLTDKEFFIQVKFLDAQEKAKHESEGKSEKEKSEVIVKWRLNKFPRYNF